MVKDLIRKAGREALHRGGGLDWVRRKNRGGLRILMYHRFHDAAILERHCEHFRRYYSPVSLGQMAEWLQREKEFPESKLALTVDDGYRDFYEVAFPVLRKHGIPATVYLITGFLDGELWPWGDRLAYAFQHTAAGEVELPCGPAGSAMRFRLDSPQSKQDAAKKVKEASKLMPDESRRELCDAVERELRAQIPERAPEAYRPLSWDEVREMARAGIEFGAHTHSHPILSRLRPEDVRRELVRSKARIEEETGRPAIHFCYPNGRPCDIGAVAVEEAQRAGFVTAVTTDMGLNFPGADRFLLRRIGVDPVYEERYFQELVAGFRM
jgi:peptidoglycan/xylan/chitin deacetylase (PgdA/CDA1 family)